MLGKSQYPFKYGVVEITKIDPDAFAPNDADLDLVRIAMEHNISIGQDPRRFRVHDMDVVITSPCAGPVLPEAVKRLQRNNVRPDHTPTTKAGLLGASGDSYEYIWAMNGLFHHGYWVRKNGVDLNVVISLHGEINEWWVEESHLSGLSVNFEFSTSDLDEAKRWVEERY